MKHFLLMLLGCGLPLLLIFLLPAFGVSEGVTLAIFLVLMLGCHLLHFKFMPHQPDESPHENHRH
ncbi:MAG: hypothetical protein KDM63_04640 [Verrucomicrobiae bacterium]|nr:hypothetical protein [Verrucomicrobiae bacterium]MCB1091793.1 hypothetical protein [Verrucomicrobiae bacterium]MCB1231214.1 hypothetical protein [Verrucomicrobiae bacterium]